VRLLVLLPVLQVRRRAERAPLYAPLPPARALPTQVPRLARARGPDAVAEDGAAGRAAGHRGGTRGGGTAVGTGGVGGGGDGGRRRG